MFDCCVCLCHVCSVQMCSRYHCVWMLHVVIVCWLHIGCCIVEVCVYVVVVCCVWMCCDHTCCRIDCWHIYMLILLCVWTSLINVHNTVFEYSHSPINTQLFASHAHICVWLHVCAQLTGLVHWCELLIANVFDSSVFWYSVNQLPWPVSVPDLVAPRSWH